MSEHSQPSAEAKDQSSLSLVAPMFRDNPALTQLLGLCPLLAVSNSTVNGLALALATLFVLLISSLLVSTTRRWIPERVRLPILVLIIAGATTAAMLLMQWFAYPIYERIALFVQIIVTNCAILAQSEQVARRQRPTIAVPHALATGLGFGAALLTLGVLRELIGQGTLFAGMERLFGAGAIGWEIRVSEDGFLLAALPPGAFILTGFLLAAHRWLLQRRES